MNVLLDENVADSCKSDIRSNQHNILFSQGYTQLNSEFPFLKGNDSFGNHYIDPR